MESQLETALEIGEIEMPELSIRQLAEKLKVSHTAIRNVMADIQAESNIEIGKAQGAGKPTLLSEAEQELIAERFYKPAPEAKIGSQTTVISPGMTYGIPGLARNAPLPLQFHTNEIDSAKESYQQQGQQAVLDMAQMVQSYATFRAVQTIREIDATFEGIKASAITQATSNLGKPRDGDSD